jgi:hypothetical protein
VTRNVEKKAVFDVTHVTFSAGWLERLKPLLKGQELLLLNNWWRKTTWPACLIGCLQKVAGDAVNGSGEQTYFSLIASEPAASRRGL